MGPEPRPLNDLDGYLLAVVGPNPRKRSYYNECWSQAPVWIPCEADADGNWQKIDDHPAYLTPTLYTLDGATSALEQIRAEHTEHFGQRVQIIDAATGAVVGHQAVAS